jgi:hypothetical protein
MVYDKKLISFIIITLLFIITISLPNVNYYVLIPMYIVFVLIGLYDLGIDEYLKEEAEKKNKAK